MNRSEYMKKYREEHKEEIRKYKKEYAKTHDSSFKKMQIKVRKLQQENQQLKIDNEKSTYQNLKLLVLLKLKGKMFDIQEYKNNELKEVIEKAINDINLLIESIKLQPTKHDNWILNRLNELNIILEDKEVK